jgi:DNA topoisomerase VI subunit A
MKIKNTQKEWPVNSSFTGIVELCDGDSWEQDITLVYYLKNGEYHRENKPAIECVNRFEGWFLNGKCHNENGPARIIIDSNIKEVEYFLNNKEYSEEQWKIEVKKLRKNRLVSK